jgi:lipopolysaccharide export system permease protein
LWVQPYCFRVLRQTLQEVRADLAATLVTPGRFTHPAPGVTVYAQSVSKDGLIRNLFIDIADADGRDTTLTAREGRVQTQGGKLMLILRHGASQEISPAGVLNFLAFDEYPFDLHPFVASDRTVQYKLSDRYPHELFFPDYRQAWERANAGKMAAEGHSRFAAALYNPAFMMLALAAVIGGPFSKPGYALRIAAAAGAALVVRTLGFAVQAAAGAQPVLNAAQYLIPLATALAAAAVIFARAGVRPRQAARAGEGAAPSLAYGALP